MLEATSVHMTGVARTEIRIHGFASPFLFSFPVGRAISVLSLQGCGRQAHCCAQRVWVSGRFESRIPAERCPGDLSGTWDGRAKSRSGPIRTWHRDPGTPWRWPQSQAGSQAHHPGGEELVSKTTRGWRPYPSHTETVAWGNSTRETRF